MKEQIALITGPNMAGKSTYIRQVALIALLAHTGSFVPATEARVDLLDRIFTRIHSRETVELQQSSFSIDVHQMHSALQHCTARSLLLVDEFGKGSSGQAPGSGFLLGLKEPRSGCPLLSSTRSWVSGQDAPRLGASQGFRAGGSQASQLRLEPRLGSLERLWNDFRHLSEVDWSVLAARPRVLQSGPAGHGIQRRS